MESHPVMMKTFKDKPGLGACLPHPAHQEFVNLLKPILEDLMVIDYVAQAGGHPAFLVHRPSPLGGGGEIVTKSGKPDGGLARAMLYQEPSSVRF